MAALPRRDSFSRSLARATCDNGTKIRIKFEHLAAHKRAPDTGAGGRALFSMTAFSPPAPRPSGPRPRVWAAISKSAPIPLPVGSAGRRAAPTGCYRSRVLQERRLPSPAHPAGPPPRGGHLAQFRLIRPRARARSGAMSRLVTRLVTRLGSEWR